MQPGDILLTRGTSHSSDLIARWSGEGGVSEFSHAALILATQPFPMVIEAVPPRVRIIPLEEALNNANYAVLMRALTLTDAQRETICRSALQFASTLGGFYGFHRFAPFAVDAILRSDWCSQWFGISKAFPVCSVFVAGTYATLDPPLEFGEPARGVTPNETGAFGYRRDDQYAMEQLK